MSSSASSGQTPGTSKTSAAQTGARSLDATAAGAAESDESTLTAPANEESFVSVAEQAEQDVSPEGRMIAEAAYFRAERRGFTPGHELEDWLAAEAELHHGAPGVVP